MRIPIIAEDRKMDFASHNGGDMNANLVHHHHNLHLQQQQQQQQNQDDIMPDLRTNSLNNILKNNIINTGGSHSPGLLILPDINNNNNSSNDLNLNGGDEGSGSTNPMAHSGCNGNVSVNDCSRREERHPLKCGYYYLPTRCVRAGTERQKQRRLMATNYNCDNHEAYS